MWNIFPRFIKMEKNTQIPYTNCSHSWPHNFLFSFINLWYVLFSYFLYQCLKYLLSPCFSNLKSPVLLDSSNFQWLNFFLEIPSNSCYYFHLYLPQWINSLLRDQGHVSLLCTLFIASGSGHMMSVRDKCESFVLSNGQTLIPIWLQIWQILFYSGPKE